MRFSTRKLLSALAIAALASGRAQTAAAQGKSHGHAARGLPPGQAKKVASPERAVSVAQEVLVDQGYEVVRVERLESARVVYYRRGNMGRGRGKGPLMKMVVRPTADRVVFEQAPSKALIQINLRLGQ